MGIRMRSGGWSPREVSIIITEGGSRRYTCFHRRLAVDCNPVRWWGRWWWRILAFLELQRRNLAGRRPVERGLMFRNRWWHRFWRVGRAGRRCVGWRPAVTDGLRCGEHG